jgi:acetolactate synthase-1/2/3 large subunit
MTALRTVGERLAEGLAARGVDVIFGIPGVHTIELYRGLADGRIRHVTPRHEQGAGFMADGYARVTGKPGVACVITGPGLLNALTAMAQAREDSVPMLVISGVNQRDSLGKGLGFLHELPDQAGMVRPLCPTETLMDPADLGAMLDRAFAAMLGARPQPVHIEIPTDVMKLPLGPLPPPAALPRPPAASAAELATAADLLNRAQRPLILAGGGMRFAEEALRDLAEALDAPVILTTNARGLLDGHPLAVPVSPTLETARDLIRGADAILALGTELGPTDYDMYFNGRLPDLSGIIRVDVCPLQLARHPCRLPVRAEAGAFATALAPLVAGRGDGAARAARTVAAALPELAAVEVEMPGAQAMVGAIRAGAPGAILVGDSTQPIYAANLFYQHDRPAGYFNAATGFGALGYGPGAAIGAAIGAPGVPVVCLIGDGGLQFSPAELRAARDENLPVTFVVWNNAGYREIARAMIEAQTKVVGCDPSPLDLAAFAQACGLPYSCVPQEPAALRDALATPTQGPRLIEVQAVR